MKKVIIASILSMITVLVYATAYACNASAYLTVKNNCPWPVTFNSDFGSTTLSAGQSHSFGEHTEDTFTVTDTYGDKATIWLHSHYHVHWSLPDCDYYYSPRDVAGYDISEYEWESYSTPTITLTACQNGAIAKIKTVGLGTASISKNGLIQSDNKTINITSGDDTYKINFTGTGTSCSFKLGQGIYCDHNDVGSIFTTGALIFTCQQVATGEGRCGWVGNNQSAEDNNTVNVSGID
ncbi:hypothetical protein L3V82_06400 [Thiotrichales bacterium 19S3-7]|nr:hypothetical protein [Thiotrichales bacterium 19S3-7]MCF6801727.1 hypothetical protein [Thiotrichales bacterium 19S3-11]